MSHHKNSECFLQESTNFDQNFVLVWCMQSVRDGSEERSKIAIGSNAKQDSIQAGYKEM